VKPGQEKHLPHELGNVVQQKQGRVKSTAQLHSVDTNDDVLLEREGEAMFTSPIQRLNFVKQ
jgi:hypothetical protein